MAEPDVEKRDELPTAPEGKRGKRPRATTFLLAAVFVALVAALLYLLSMINSRRFCFELEGDRLIIKKGMFFPWGMSAFVPEDPVQRAVFAPVRIPPGQTAGAREFGDRAEMERELFNILLRWASDRVYSDNTEEFALGSEYMERLGRLKASSEELRRIGGLRGDLFYREGRRMIDEAMTRLRSALKKFSESGRLGGDRFTDTDTMMRAATQALRILEGRASAFSPEEIEALKRQAFVEGRTSPDPSPPDGGTPERSPDAANAPSTPAAPPPPAGPDGGIAGR